VGCRRLDSAEVAGCPVFVHQRIMKDLRGRLYEWVRGRRALGMKRSKTTGTVSRQRQLCGKISPLQAHAVFCPLLGCSH
jgi:hypothetical protein